MSRSHAHPSPPNIVGTKNLSNYTNLFQNITLQLPVNDDNSIHHSNRDIQLISMLDTLFSLTGNQSSHIVSYLLITHLEGLGAVFASDERKLRSICPDIDDRTVSLIKIIANIICCILKEPFKSQPLLNCTSAVMTYLSVKLRHETRESFHVLFLNKKYYLLADEVHSIGSVDTVAIYPREIVKRVLELDASSVLIAHNHPSGDPTPSAQDIVTTNKIKSALQTIDVVLHDHIIVGKTKEESFKKLGLL